MIQMSFSEKIKVLVDVSSSSGICIASIFLLVFIGTLFLTTNRKNVKSSRKLYISIYILLFVIMLIQYYSSLADMYDYMMNNFFIIFYFPNLAVYLAAIIIANIILWNTIFNFKEDKLLKYINTTIYCMIHYLLILILNVVTTNKLDVFDQSSVYKNTDAAALIGLSSTIFIVWICFIIVYKIIRKTQKKTQKGRVPVRRIIKYKKKLPENYQPINLPETIEGKAGSLRPKAAYVQPDLVDFYKQQKETKQDDLLKQYESIFTIDDYKKMIEILKGKKEVTSVSIETEFNEEIDNHMDSKFEEKKLEVISATTEEINNEQDEKIPQPKLEELLNLYNSI